MKPGQHNFYISPVYTRIHGLSDSETLFIRKVYEQFGMCPFSVRDITAKVPGVVFNGRRYREACCIDPVGIDGRGCKIWKIRDAVAARFELDLMVDFDPYKREKVPFDKLKVNKRYIHPVGMTLDQRWYYCKCPDFTGYTEVMVRCYDYGLPTRLCRVYKVDWEKCWLWLNTNLYDGNQVGDSVKCSGEPGLSLA